MVPFSPGRNIVLEKKIRLRVSTCITVVIYIDDGRTGEWYKDGKFRLCCDYYSSFMEDDCPGHGCSYVLEELARNIGYIHEGADEAVTEVFQVRAVDTANHTVTLCLNSCVTVA